MNADGNDYKGAVYVYTTDDDWDTVTETQILGPRHPLNDDGTGWGSSLAIGEHGVSQHILLSQSLTRSNQSFDSSVVARVPT